MKTVQVVAAVIFQGDTIYATQRGYGPWRDYWEFPGGKIEPGETPQQALRREIREELDTEITVGELLHTVEWDYPKFHLTMHCFLCTVERGSLTLLEHEAARWLLRDELGSVNWLPADKELVEELQNKSYQPLPSSASKEQDGNNPIPTQRSMGGKPSIP